MERREDCEEVVIVGGGIAGLATALALKRLGLRSLVLEGSTQLRATVAAVTLFPTAWRALHALAVVHKLSDIYPPYYGGSVTDVATGAVRRFSYTGSLDRGEMGVRTVHGEALLQALAEELPTASIRFSSKLASIRIIDAVQDSPTYVLQMEDGKIIKAKVLVGCDGLYSVVGQWLGLAAPVHSGFEAVRGVSVFPEGHRLKYEVEQFVGDRFRAGFVPLSDKEVHWFIIYKSSTEGEECPREAELVQKHVLEKLAKNFPPIYKDIVRRCDLATLTSVPMMYKHLWDVVLGTLCKGTATVAGDAMHPITPDLLQGGGSALVDAIVLGNAIGGSVSRTSGGFGTQTAVAAMQSYAKEQRWNVARLAVASYLMGWVQQRGSGWVSNFIRDKVAWRLIYTNIADAMNHYDGLGHE